IGTYNVTVRDANGCVNVQDIQVNELVLELDPLVAAIQEPRCNGENNGRITVNIDNGIGPYEYDFNQGNGFESSAILDNIPSGIYDVNVRDVNNCQGVFTFEVEDPPVVETTLDAQDISCAGQQDGMVGVVASGGRPDYTYLWSNDATTPTISNLDAGTYTVTITDANGCPEIVDTFIIEPQSIIGEVVEVVDNLCFGEDAGSVTLAASGGSPGFEYSVDGINFQMDSTLVNLPAGDYIFTIRDSEGCTNTVTASITEPTEFIIDPGQDLLLNLGFDTTLTAVSNYRPVQFNWGPDSVQCLNFDCSRVLVQPFNSTTYVVTGINEAGCIATAEVQVRVVDSKPVFIPNAFSPDGDGINDGFTLFAGPAVTSIETFRVFDRWGGMVFESPTAIRPNEPSLGWNGVTDGRPVNAGVYIYYFQVRFLNDEVVEYSGDVAVIR
ncbi:MAG: gliding motility-associated C-terminal domain-containing protein, partial [Bacteroidota bacterium]